MLGDQRKHGSSDQVIHPINIPVQRYLKLYYALHEIQQLTT